MADLPVVDANHGHPLPIVSEPFRAVIDIAHDHTGQVAHQRLEFGKQVFTEMTAAPTVNNNLTSDAQGNSVTRAPQLLEARLQPARPNPAVAPNKAARSPPHGSSTPASQAQISIALNGST